MQGKRVIDFTREDVNIPPPRKLDFYRESEVVEKKEEIKPTGFMCDKCGYESKTEQGMKVHCSRKHKE